MTGALITGCSDSGVTPPKPPPPPPPPPPPNAIQLLALSTYEGSGQAVHPDAVITPAGWGGRDESNSLHLVVTPYPKGQASFENPSIFVGQSITGLTVPTGVQNPIAQPPSDGYLSDPDELFNPGTNELWLYYRQVTTTNQVLLIRSPDGVHWQSPIPLVTVPNHQAVSPTIIRRSSTDWWLWTVNAGADGCTATSTLVELRHSADGIHWSSPQPVQLGGSDDFPWHLDVSWIPELHQFWALYNAKVAGSCTTQILRFATSQDGVHWTTAPTPVLTSGAIPEFADIVYRSSLQYDATTDMVSLWYSGAQYVENAYLWHIAVQQMSRATLFARVMHPAEPLALKQQSPSSKAGAIAPPPLTDATAP